MPLMSELGSLRLGDMAKGGEPVPEAVYHVRIAKTEAKRADPSAEDPDPWPYVAVTYIITGQSPEEYHGRYVFENLTLAPGKNFALRSVAEAVGFTENDDVLSEIENGGFTDRELLISVGIEKAREDKKTGKKYDARNKVTKRLPLQA